MIIVVDYMNVDPVFSYLPFFVNLVIVMFKML